MYFNPNQRNISLQQIMITKESKLASEQRKRDCNVLSSNWDIYLNTLLAKLSDHCRRGGGRILRVRNIRHLLPGSTYEIVWFSATNGEGLTKLLTSGEAIANWWQFSWSKSKLVFCLFLKISYFIYIPPLSLSYSPAHLVHILLHLKFMASFL